MRLDANVIVNIGNGIALVILIHAAGVIVRPNGYVVDGNAGTGKL